MTRPSRFLRRNVATRASSAQDFAWSAYWVPGEEPPRERVGAPGIGASRSNPGLGEAAAPAVFAGTLRRRRVLGWTIVAIAAVLVVWAVLFALSALGALRSASAAHRRLEGLDDFRAFLSAGNLHELPGRLNVASADLAAAERDLSSPWVRSAAWIPFVGTQIDSASAIVGASERAVAAVGPLVQEATVVTEHPPLTPAARLGDLRVLSKAATVAAAELDIRSFGPARGLLGALATERRKVLTEVTSVHQDMLRLGVASSALHRMLKGPTSLLLLAGNNAEMRNGSGMVLQVGRLSFRNGRVRLGKLRSAPLGDLPSPGIRLPASLQRVWGWQEPGRFWEEIGVDPDFPVSARAAEALWARDGGKPVNGVIYVDTTALAEIVRATGPVLVDGREMDSTELSHYLLLKQYRGLGYPTAEQTDRREELGRIASVVLGRLEKGPYRAHGLFTLARALADAVGGRHVMLFSNSSALEAEWAEVGAAGRFPADGLMVSVQNRGGNKLDQFLAVRVSISQSPKLDTPGAHLVEVRVSIDNRAPRSGLARYVSGPFPGLDVAPGTYVGIVTFDLPLATSHVEVVRGPRPDAAGAVGRSFELGLPVTLAPGAHASLELRLRVPATLRKLQFLPSARYPAEERLFDGRALAPGRSVPIVLDASH